jgi:hypothetical protein
LWKNGLFFDLRALELRVEKKNANKTPIVTEPTNAEPIDSDDEPLN